MKSGQTRLVQRKRPHLPGLPMKLHSRILRPGIACQISDFCPVQQRLMEQYNRRFNSWVAHEDEGRRLIDTAESERLALAYLEEAHQKLLQHQQSCPTCQRRRPEQH